MDRASPDARGERARPLAYDVAAWVCVLLVAILAVTAAASAVAARVRGRILDLGWARDAPAVGATEDAAIEIADGGVWWATNMSPREGSSSAAPPALAPPRVEDELVEQFCLPAARALCDARARCCVRAEPSCEDDVFAACTRGLPEVVDLDVDGGEVDRDALDGCLRDLSAAAETCDLERAFDRCTRLVREPVELGGACELEGAPCRGGCCDEATCAPLPGIGDAPGDAACADGLMVVDDHCDLRPRAGEPCHEDECDRGLRCAWGMCRPPVLALGRCRTTDACAAGLVCSGRRCRAGPTWCDYDESCGAGLVCVHTYETTCVPSATRGLVGRAGVCPGRSTCAPGETCRRRSRGGRCEPELCEAGALVLPFGGPAGEPIPWPR